MREKKDHDLVINSPTTSTSLKLHCFDAIIFMLLPSCNAINMLQRAVGIKIILVNQIAECKEL